MSRWAAPFSTSLGATTSDATSWLLSAVLADVPLAPAARAAALLRLASMRTLGWTTIAFEVAMALEI